MSQFASEQHIASWLDDEERYCQRVLHNLNQSANKLGMKLVVVEGA